MITIDQLPVDSAEFTELSNYRGELFQQWLDCWNALPPGEKDPYTHPVWLISWLKHDPAAHAEDFIIFAFRKQDRLLGLLPCQAQRRKSPLSILYYMYYLRPPLVGYVSSSLALSADDHAEALELVLRTAWKGWGKPAMIRFLRVDQTNALLRSNLVMFAQPALPRFFRRLDEGYEGLWRDLSRNFRRKMRKMYNRAEKVGELRFETQTEQGEMLAAYDDFMNLEMSGWKRTSPYALRSDAVTRGFYQSLIEGARVTPGIEMTTHRLLINEQVIAVKITYIHDKTLYSLKTAYAEDFANLSPGYLADDFLFRDFCPARGIVCLNVISSAPRFSYWKPERLETFDVCVFPRTWRGKSCKLAFGLRDKFFSRRAPRK